MVDLLSSLRLAGSFFAGVALFALLHGILAQLDRAAFLLHAIAFIVFLVSFILEDHLQPYGFLLCGVMVLGIVVWSL
ncbi:hypothetical protein NIES2135_53810 [Leptolyngbya boryana NIES-2135]|jgi:hypothetical protein|uniref:Uncharacterized protein n=1 Tax=Leptolyngbya boryana NIES-2135 TaxID=1973484 RepID=A0A1Z4JPD8_LEPBY|nr:MULTISPECIES: hypothetical protein [Leptolyngbya]BAY58508.1 hypothetical protein NIES2135_53810 [Leptolyngbya boryana NIES-2135]MBD2370982.1 hypothetical protein [Leptolyngbya sp. FACHB-161]MBD2377496.1 hypothetical protein [Leptolyngbya sp. FACHB-238]MBD2401905.1 hypothetical protein [Leptolyngbya sp. FACHB-239]MBD2408422.1 hypothetical protein [Leptolyngbya sp. FACHB-402]